MTSEEGKEVRAFLLLNRLAIAGRRRALTLLGEGKPAAEIVVSTEFEELFTKLPSSQDGVPFDPDREIELCAQKGIDFLLYTDADYPALLKEVADPPLVLYKKGVFAETDRHAIAVVGTRHPSFYGRTQAKRFSQDLAAKGLTIVSGLARGIDQVAHDAALQVSYGRTIAVMGCGLDITYPKEHEGLFNRIAERGVILSEYPLGTPPLPENFPRRNRILSGLAYATLVIEAHSRSGSLITAHQAVEQGREVFALPGPVDQLTSRGTHQLIKEGAYLAETPDDILLVLADRLRLENPVQQICSPESSVTSEEKKPVNSGPIDLRDEKTCDVAVEAKEVPLRPALGEIAGVIEELLKEEGALSREEILEFTGLEPAQLPGCLLQLEILKRIHRAPDGRYGLKG